MDQNKKPLSDALEKYLTAARVRMHMPGHKGRPGLLAEDPDMLLRAAFSGILQADITEISGFDDLHAPEDIIRESQELAADLFGADETYFLVNGTTCGIMAAIASSSSEDAGVIVSRDCHESVMRGLIMSGANPVFVKPHFDDENSLSADIDPDEIERIFRTAGGISAVVLSHPSYYGTYSDLERIVRIAHSHGAVVIADEAHGAQLGFIKDSPAMPALACGADIAVQSTHKMIGSLTQSSMLHVQGDLVDRSRLRYFVSMMQSTSPSYILMASLDEARYIMAVDGLRIWDNVIRLAAEAADEISRFRGFGCLRYFNSYSGARIPVEPSRLIIRGSGMNGRQLAGRLLDDYGIDMEFADDLYATALLGTGTRREDIRKLVCALRDISAAFHPAASCRQDEEKVRSLRRRLSLAEWQRSMTPRTAVMSPHVMTDIRYAEELTSAVSVSMYPPGIPFLQPGEVITAEIRNLIQECTEAGVHMHGVSRTGQDGIFHIATVEDRHLKMMFGCVL